MKITLPRVIWPLIVVSATAWSAFGEQFQCKNAAGCPASVTSGGKTNTVVFRKGDIVDTDSGWVVNRELGWSKVARGITPSF